MTPTEQLLRDALETGLVAAEEVAYRTHESLAGYLPHKHEAVDADVAEIKAAIAMLAATSQQMEGEPHIVEALSWHANERDDLTLDETIEVIRHGWKKVRGRHERDLLLQIAALLATPPYQAPEPEEPSELLSIGELAWALIAPTGDIRYWSFIRKNVEAQKALHPNGTIVPIIGAAPASPSAAQGEGT